MVTLVVCENENTNIGARPLMLPLQQADICTATIYWQFISFVFFY